MKLTFQALLCLSCVILPNIGAFAVGTASPCPAISSGGVLELANDCTWANTRAVGALGVVSLLGAREDRSEPAVVTISGPPEDALQHFQEAGATAVSPGIRLQLQRLMLIGFAYAEPGSAKPFLWPQGLLQQAGMQLNLIDVRLVISDLAVFNSWLQVFQSSSNVTYWTDNSTFIHVYDWSDGVTTLKSVGLLLQQTDDASGKLGPSPALTENVVLAATNGTLVPSLMAHASIVTKQPLLVYITTNVSLGLNPQLPASGLAINRPVVFVGLQSLVTSIDFQMVVNQLNETGSTYSNVTFVGLVLENLAPGDSESSALAAPLSIAVSNNVWAAFYNRTVPDQVRVVFVNVTMVIPEESEMSYVTYMFTMYTSQSPYLRQQTRLWSDVMHVSMLQFAPGPGDEAITANHIKSLYHNWYDVILTTLPLVAKPLPVPPRPVVVSSSTRVSPLVQAVHSTQELQVAGESPLIADREHVLLLLSNLSMAELGSNSTASLQLQSGMTWMGTSAAASAVQDSAANVYVGFGYIPSAVKLLSPAAALQLQQLVLWQLPQGPNASAAVGAAGARTPKEVWTMLLWCFDRPVGKQLLGLRDVQLQLPGPELQYLLAAVARASDFVIGLDGHDSSTLTFQDVSCIGSPCTSLHVGSFQGPGIEGTDITLLLDSAAATSIPGYVWPAEAVPAGQLSSNGMAPWAVAVLAVCVSGAAMVLAVVGCLVSRHRKRAANSHLLPAVVKDVELGASQTTSADQSEDSQFLVTAGSKGTQPCLVSSKGDNANLDLGLQLTSGTGSCATIDSAPDIEAQSRSRAMAAAASAGKDVDAAQLHVEAVEQQPTDQGTAGVHGPLHAPPGSAAFGMQRMRAAISSTARLLMERRMDVTLPVAPFASTGTGSSGARAGYNSKLPENQSAGRSSQMKQQDLQPAPAGELPGSADGSSGLQLKLQSLLGQGSFGCVYLASWHGKQVAVKVMQLPATAVAHLPGVDLMTPFGQEQQQDQCNGAGSPRQHQRQKHLLRKQQNSASNMAVMEAVLSSAMSHPNVVQVYTFMVNPLMSSPDSANGQASHTGAAAALGHNGPSSIAGWELKIVMEYCEQGSLRDSLDCGLLSKPGRYLGLPAVLQLAHDVASAMLHLHSEGVVHGDLKAGNIMLTHSGTNSCTNHRVLSTRGGRPVTAKVADFGLAMPLGPTDTHATLLARGTPTHMSPELFISGHVGRASDVYAYGILLFEVITGQRAFAGVPIPLLPHEVARQGLRPTWPADLPAYFKDLMRLAESCWASKPADRPSFEEIMGLLDDLAETPDATQAGPQPAASQLVPREVCVGSCSNCLLTSTQCTATCGAAQPEGRPLAENRAVKNLLQVQGTNAAHIWQHSVNEAAPAQLPLLHRVGAAVHPEPVKQQPAGRVQNVGGYGRPTGLITRIATAGTNRGQNVNLSWSQVDCGVS